MFTSILLFLLDRNIMYIFHLGVQEQLQMRGGQEEPDSLQGLSSPQVSHGRHVQVRLSLRPPIQLV